jgi:hypothetical protein
VNWNVPLRSAWLGAPHGDQLVPAASINRITFNLTGPYTAAFLRPFMEDYSSLSAIYAVVAKAYTKTVYVDKVFRRKTNQLVQKPKKQSIADQPLTLLWSLQPIKSISYGPFSYNHTAAPAKRGISGYPEPDRVAPASNFDLISGATSHSVETPSPVKGRPTQKFLTTRGRQWRVQPSQYHETT